MHAAKVDKGPITMAAVCSFIGYHIAVRPHLSAPCRIIPQLSA
jgi:hypothetical protein